MAALDGHVVELAVSGNTNTKLSPGLHMLGFDAWPPHEAMVGAGIVGTVARVMAAANPRAVSGQRARSFSDDWYHRIHVIPHVLNLGNLASAQTESIYVWNAFLQPQTLLGMAGVEEGMTLDGPDDFPMPFGALQVATWDIGVAISGPSIVDATISWTFDGIDAGTLSITGIRITAWPFVPDWREGVRERLSWATDVLTSETAVEQRRGLRLAPRRSFSASLLVDDRERSLYDLMMHSWGGRIWALPIWPDVQLLSNAVALGATSIACATTGRDFRVGGLAMLRGESAFTTETVEIDTITGSELTLARPTQLAWPAGSRLYPARTARFPVQPAVRRLTDRATWVEAQFVLVEPSDWAAASLPTYRGFPIFDARPDESEELTATFARALRELDVITSTPYTLDMADVALDLRLHRWVLNGVTERNDFRSLLYALDGRRVAVWVPTHADDLTVTATISSASTALTIEQVGYTRFGLGQLGRRDIRIELRDGSVFYRRISNAVEIEGGEQLSIDTALGQIVEPGAIARISYMALMRLESDEVELRHLTDVAGVATSNVTFRSVRDEL